MTAALIQGRPAAEVLASDFWEWGPLHPEVEAVARGSWARKEPPGIKGTGYSVAALEAALWAVAGAADFASAVLRAANLGDDADTTAAIGGQLAGARWGWSGIRADWRGRITEGERIAGIASRLHDAGAEAEIPDTWPFDGLIHAYWVEPVVVLAGEYPGSLDGPRATRRKLDVLVDQGMRTFVDLTTSADRLDPYGDLLGEIAARRQLDLRRITHPIPDMGVVDGADYAAIVATVRAAAERGGVYLHCWGGIGRTATVVGCLLVDAGFGAEDALAEITRRRSITRKAHSAAPQTEQQRAVVRAFRPGR